MRSLRQTLEREGLTQEEAAHALGVTRVTIYRWLDADPVELPGKASLWCAGLMKVNWPEPFKPALELSIPPEAIDAALERRLELANRVLRSTVRAFVDINDLRAEVGRDEQEYPHAENAHGEKESQADDWNLSGSQKSTVSNLTETDVGRNTSDMDTITTTGVKLERTSLTMAPSDLALLDELTTVLGTSRAAFVRMLLRRYGRRMAKEIGGE